jgi:hypothetical protein
VGSGLGQGGRQLKGGGSKDEPPLRRVRCAPVVLSESSTCYRTKTRKVLKQRIECNDVGWGAVDRLWCIDGDGSVYQASSSRTVKPALDGV